MKRKSLLLFLFSIVSLTMVAQDRDVHGVKGYWNYTAQQLQALGDPFTFFNDGTKNQNWYRDVQFDGDYMVLYPGINSTDLKTFTTKIAGSNKVIERQGYDWRVSFNLFHSAYPLKVTKNYPVVAVKMSVPTNVLDSVAADCFSEMWWINPYTGKEAVMWCTKDAGKNTDLPAGTEAHQENYCLSGIGGNSRVTWFVNYQNVGVQEEKWPNYGEKDSVAIFGWGPNDIRKIEETGVLYADNKQKNADSEKNKKEVSIRVLRLPATCSEKANIIMLLNFAVLPDADPTNLNNPILERTDITIPRWHFNWYAAQNTIDEEENELEQENRPVAYFKWLKTFKSLDDAMAAITEENNWGDGTMSAAKSQLNDALYWAEVALKAFRFRNSDPDGGVYDDEAYIAYNNAYEAANAVWNNASATDADYQNAFAALQEARVNLLIAADIDNDLVYNYVYSAAGDYSLVIGDADVTIGSLTGKPITIGAKDAAKALSFIKTGSLIDGQNSYYLAGSDGGFVVQAADGTLLYSTEATAGSAFTFSERDTEGHSFDIRCGDYYYYVDANGSLAFSEEIPEDATTNFDALAAYLFTVEDALGDYAQKASEEEKSGLLEGWEFNSTPVDDPGTIGVYNEEQKTMAEYSETKMIDNWRMSRWRAHSRVNQETVKNSDGSDAVCLALTSAEVYDNWDGSQTGIQNDWSTPPAFRMDGGTEEPFYARDPNPRDDRFAYYINAGLHRYFAIKMKSTENIEFGTFNIFSLTGTSVLLSKNQMERKGESDVYYFDLLNCGFPVGKRQYTAGFFSPALVEGKTSQDCKFLVDWMRIYDSIDEIPAESFDESVLSTGIKTISDNTNKSNDIYDLFGRRVINPVKGLYIIGGKKVVVK
ncbi:MAG: hypothetical protein ACI3ZB_11705 [Prevotella sp.]